MKQYVKMFEQFLTNPAEELALKKQFATSEVTMNVPITHQVSQIVSDEHGMKVNVGDPTVVGEVIVVDPAETKDA
jgi:hypothetical protein